MSVPSRSSAKIVGFICCLYRWCERPTLLS
ncbi:protein of unknown function [Stenotrophomonas maltophilia]|nr:protein of unknown function [Stenotrophomonas maltophilia]